MQESTGKIFELESSEEKKELEKRLGEELLAVSTDTKELCEQMNRAMRRSYAHHLKKGFSPNEAALKVFEK